MPPSNPYQSPQATPLAPAQSGTFLGHPMGLFVLFVVEMWERFSYYGMRGLLVLYLKRSTEMVPDASGLINPGRGWSEAEASTLYGWYTGLAYLVPIIGGLIADKLIGTHRSMVLGGGLIALGHVVLGISGLGDWAHNHLGMSIFIFGLALIVIGTGHFKPCVSVMVGQLYSEKDPRRDSAFSIFYMGINLGAFICAFVCGTLGETVGWHWGFGAAAVGMILGLVVYLAARPYYLWDVGLPPPGRGMWETLVWVPVAVLVSGMVGYAYFQGYFNTFQTEVQEFTKQNPLVMSLIIGTVVIGILAAAANFVWQQEPEDRGPVASIFIFMVLNVFFWLAFEQAGSSINVFTDEKTDRTLFVPWAKWMWNDMSTWFSWGNWTVPATWFQSVNAFFIIVLSPIMAVFWSYLSYRQKNPTQAVKIAIGLIFLGLGFVLMVIAGNIAAAPGVQAGMGWLIGCYILHTIGELFISPTGLSYVSRAAPVRFVSLLMGIWFISSFVANLVGGLIASQVEAIEKGEIQMPWNFGGRADFFMLFVVTSLGMGVLTLIASPLLNWIAGKRGEG
ncbi:MAG: peptide MFS transporter [Pirellulales bacterium]|nr:peptide MFS transporter [Pirellulales bacterium]